MFRLAMVCLCLCVSATSASAFDCSSAVPLICDGPVVSGLIGLPPEVTFASCGNLSNTNHKIFSLTVANAQEVTVTVTGAAAAAARTVIFAGCDENDCIASSPLNSSVLPATCLEPGTYTIALEYPTEIVAPFEISVSCVDCEPVAVKQESWGVLKSSYR